VRALLVISQLAATYQRRLGRKEEQRECPPFLVFKLSKNILIVQKYWYKNANLWLKPPILENFGVKLKFCAPYRKFVTVCRNSITYVEKMQFSAPPTYLVHGAADWCKNYTRRRQDKDDDSFYKSNQHTQRC